MAPFEQLCPGFDLTWNKTGHSGGTPLISALKKFKVNLANIETLIEGS